MAMMDPYEYQLAAQRTECDQIVAAERFYTQSLQSTRLNHAALGIAGEAGELAGAVERWLYYGRQLDRTNVKEELGDLMWYIALACNAMDFNLEEVMAANIRKLKKRYPEKYSDQQAAEENRDRQREREELERPRPTPSIPLTNDYPRYCKVCGLQPVHKNNTSGVCADCVNTNV